MYFGKADSPLLRARRGLFPWGRGSNRAYFTWLVAGCFLLSILAFLPCLDDLLQLSPDSVHPSLLRQVGRVTSRRSNLVIILCLWLVPAVGYCVLSLPLRRLRTWRTVALVLAGFHGAALTQVNYRAVAHQTLAQAMISGRVLQQQWESLRCLKIVEVPPLDFPLAESRQQLRHQHLTTFRDLHRQVMAGYQRVARQLARRWAVEDEQRLKALYLMNYVAGFWAFGNHYAVDQPSGVLFNEENNWQEEPPSLQAYLEANIGCCEEIAYLLKFFLDCEGIENRLTTIPGHVFNEALLGGRWCLLDATVNFFMERSWEELYTTAKPERDSIPVYLFPHPGLVNAQADCYRPILGQFRLAMLLRIATLPRLYQPTDHPPLPEYFQ